MEQNMNFPDLSIGVDVCTSNAVSSIKSLLNEIQMSEMIPIECGMFLFTNGFRTLNFELPIEIAEVRPR